MRQLARLQRSLSRLYDVSIEQSVGDYLCGATCVTHYAGEAQTERGEVLLVVESEDDLHLGLYLEPEILQALRRRPANRNAANRNTANRNTDLATYCLALEGVSHFLYLSFRAAHHHAVSQLELELQAEVDKYATLLLERIDLPHSDAALGERSRHLRRRLFGEVQFLDASDSEAGERYRLAHRLAAHYSASLETRYVLRGNLAALKHELRHFYRMGANDKCRMAAH